MKNLKKHVALVLALILVLSLAPLTPTQSAFAAQSTRTISHNDFTLEFIIHSSWNSGYNAEMIITNNTSQGLYQWVLNLNRNMGLLEDGVQGGKLAHQQGNVTTIGYIDWNSYIPAGGSVTLWLTNTRTNGSVPVPTDFRINQATRRLVPVEDYTHTVEYHSEWDPSRFGLGLSTINRSDRVIQGWELEFDINGRVDTTSIGTLTYATTGAAIIIHTPRSNQSWHPGQNNYFTLGGTGSMVTITNLRIYEMIAEPYLDFADDGGGFPGWPDPYIPNNESPLYWPSSSGEVTLWFGIVDSFYQSVNKGITIQEAPGSPVYSVADAVVVDVLNTISYGTVVVTSFRYNNQNMQARHLYLGTATVNVGDRLTKGQQLGTKGEHENFGVRNGLLQIQLFDEQGTEVDPALFMERPEYDIHYFSRPMVYSMQTINLNHRMRFETTPLQHRRFMANMDLNEEAGEVYLWRIAYNFVLSQGDHMSPEEFMESGILTWDDATRTATFSFGDIHMEFTVDDYDDPGAFSPFTDSLRAGNRIVNDRMVISIEHFISIDGDEFTFPDGLEWWHYTAYEINLEMYITVYPVPNFGKFGDAQVGIIRLIGNPVVDVHVMVDGQWQFIGQAVIIEDDDIDQRTLLHNWFIRWDSMTTRNTLNLFELDAYEFLWLILQIIHRERQQIVADINDTITLALEVAEYTVSSLVNASTDTIDYIATNLMASLESLLESTLREAVSSEVTMRVFQLMHQVWQHRSPNAHAVTVSFENFRFAINNVHSRTIMRRGFIHGQGLSPQGDLEIGPMGNGARNGCGPFAIYNALFYLRGGAEILPDLEDDTPGSVSASVNNLRRAAREAIAQNPAAIIRNIGFMGGFNLGGVTGTNPIAMYQYLSGIGYGASIYWGNDIGNLDSMIRDAEVSILLYQGGLTYIHYVMVRVLGDGEFAIYNLVEYDEEHTTQASINNWISSTGNTPLALIIVR